MAPSRILHVLRLAAFLVTTAFMGWPMALSQDLNQIGGTPFVLSGNLVAGTQFQQSTGTNPRKGLGYFLRASPTLNIYGIAIPMSFSYRDRQGSISHPFNRTSLHPTYKWATLHLGDVSLSMHPFALAGQNIKGGGVELKPGSWLLQAVVGKMENPLVQIDSFGVPPLILDSYKRRAQAIKVGRTGKNQSWSWTLLRVSDETTAIADKIDSVRVKPQENLVTGPEIKIQFFKALQLKLLAAASLHTADLTPLDILPDDIKEQLNRSAGLITLNHTSRLHLAYEAGLDTRIKGVNIGAQYKRIAPEYTSLGAYYFQNDLESYTASLGFTLLKKIRLALRGGVQRNDLIGVKANTTWRRVGNLNLNYLASRSFSVALRYSNLQTGSEPKIVAVADSLRLTRTNTTMAVTPRLLIRKGDQSHTFSAMGQYQQMDEVQLAQPIPRAFETYMANLSYRLTNKETKTVWQFRLLYFENHLQGRIISRMGLTTGYGRHFLKDQLHAFLQGGYTLNELNNSSNGSSLFTGLRLKYKSPKRISLTARINYHQRLGIAIPFQRISGAMSVGYSFTTKPKKS